LWAFLTLRDFKFHSRTFLQRFESGALDFAVVGKQVLAAIIRRDEPIALFTVKAMLNKPRELVRSD